MNPKALRIAQQKAEAERVKAEAIAAGKKPPADPPSTANITPFVEYRELEVDLKAVADWRKNPSLQFPPGARVRSAQRGENPKVDFEYVLSQLNSLTGYAYVYQLLEDMVKERYHLNG